MQKYKENIIFHSICCTIYLLIVIPIQIILTKEFNSLDPARDFTPISPNCTITEYIYEESSQITCGKNCVKCGCKDKYSYIFAAPQLADIDSYYAGRNNDGYQFKSLLKRKLSI